MKETDSPMTRFLAEVRDHITRRGLLTFPDSIIADGHVVFFPVELGLPAFFDLAAALSVRMVYLSTDTLEPPDVLDDLAQLVEDADETFGGDSLEVFFRDQGLSANARVKRFRDFVADHAGKLRSVHVEWVHEGVVHRYSRFADWHRALMDQVTEIADILDAQAGES
ncbi:MAG: hypothetical protein NTY23_14190 [Chloroflexi bacterium]|nr:hypothetical protein [Chloroflexota bacterium]